MRLVSTFNAVNLLEDPSLASDGELYFNTASNVFRYYTSGSWVSLSYDKNETIYEFGGNDVVSFEEHINETHIGSIILANCTASATINVPRDNELNLPIGSKFTVARVGPGTVQFGHEDLIFIPDGNYLTAVWEVVDLIKFKPDQWIIKGSFPDIY